MGDAPGPPPTPPSGSRGDDESASVGGEPGNGAPTPVPAPSKDHVGSLRLGGGSAATRTRHRVRSLIGLLAVSVVVTLVSGFFIGKLRPASLLPVGSRAPLIDLGAQAPVRSDIVAGAAGRPLVVEFFESTCTTCQETAVDLCTVLRDHADVEVAAIDAAREGQSQVDGFRHDHLGSCASDRRLITLADPCRPLGASPCNNVSDRWKVHYVPTVYVVDAHGVIAYAASGGGAPQGAGPALDRLRGGGG